MQWRYGWKSIYSFYLCVVWMDNVLFQKNTQLNFLLFVETGTPKIILAFLPVFFTGGGQSQSLGLKSKEVNFSLFLAGWNNPLHSSLATISLAMTEKWKQSKEGKAILGRFWRRAKWNCNKYPNRWQMVNFGNYRSRNGSKRICFSHIIHHFLYHWIKILLFFRKVGYIHGY